MKQTLSIPTFGLRELDSISVPCKDVCLRVYVLFWMVCQMMCSVSAVDNAPTWSATVEYFGIGLLHPSHRCFSALLEQGCFLSSLLAQELRGCWMLNKVSKKHRNHSVLMHLNTHIPEYVLAWQFGLSCVKQLMKFQLIQGEKKK